MSFHTIQFTFTFFDKLPEKDKKYYVQYYCQKILCCENSQKYFIDLDQLLFIVLVIEVQISNNDVNYEKTRINNDTDDLKLELSIVLQSLVRFMRIVKYTVCLSPLEKKNNCNNREKISWDVFCQPELKLVVFFLVKNLIAEVHKRCEQEKLHYGH